MRFLSILDRYSTSCVIIACSFWAALVLSQPPSNFVAFPVAFRVVQVLGVPEGTWAAFVAAGASMNAIGIFLKVRNIDLNASRGIGFVGLAAQTWFWLYFGGSAVISNPDTLFGFCGLMVGVAAAWRLCRYAWSPDV